MFNWFKKKKLAANTHDSPLGLREGFTRGISGGNDFADRLHNVFLDYGYPEDLDFFNFWNMYRRFGIARRVVELFPDQTWLDDPVVNSVGEDGEPIEGGTQFDRELALIEMKFGLWRRLKGLDTRQRVGRYAGLFMRVLDSKKPQEPIEGKLAGVDSLVDMIPLYENQLEVLTTEDDPLSDNFGMPTMYQFNGGATGNRNEKEASAFSIHPSRIIIASEDSDNSGIYGIPVLESIFNSLMDLRKILGGGGEGFYRNAAQSIIFSLKDPDHAVSELAEDLKTFNERADDFIQNRFRRSLMTPGMDTTTLESNLISPLDFANTVLMDIAAGSNIPTTLLVGNQTGKLAGDQDTRGFLTQVQSRRVDFGTELVTNTLKWMIEFGILASSKFEVEWMDALAPSTEQKLTNADKMADINQKTFLSGGGPAFQDEEIREAGGFDPEELPDMPDETLNEDE